MGQKELVYKKTKGLAPFAYTVVDQWLYFCDQQTPGLFRYNFETEEYECVAKFNINYVKMNFYKILSYKEELWLLPFLDGKIVCFNINSGKMEYYDIPNTIEEKAIPFFDIIFMEERAYILPHGRNRFLIEMSLLDHSMRSIELLKVNPGEKKSFISGAVQIGNQLYLSECSKDILIIYHIINNNIVVVDAKGYHLENLFPIHIENKIYFLPIVINKEEKLLIYDINADCFEQKEYPIKSLPEREICIAVGFKEKLWILANSRKKVFRLNKNLDIEEEIAILSFNEEGKKVYVSATVFDNCFFWHGHDGTPLLEMKDDIVQILDIRDDKNILDIYIEMIDKCDKYKSKQNKGNIGKAIYNKVIL